MDLESLEKGNDILRCMNSIETDIGNLELKKFDLVIQGKYMGSHYPGITTKLRNILLLYLKNKLEILKKELDNL